MSGYFDNPTAMQSPAIPPPLMTDNSSLCCRLTIRYKTHHMPTLNLGGVTRTDGLEELVWEAIFTWDRLSLPFMLSLIYTGRICSLASHWYKIREVMNYGGMLLWNR